MTKREELRVQKETEFMDRLKIWSNSATFICEEPSGLHELKLSKYNLGVSIEPKSTGL